MAGELDIAHLEEVMDDEIGRPAADRPCQRARTAPYPESVLVAGATDDLRAASPAIEKPPQGSLEPAVANDSDQRPVPKHERRHAESRILLRDSHSAGAFANDDTPFLDASAARWFRQTAAARGLRDAAAPDRHRVDGTILLRRDAQFTC